MPRTGLFGLIAIALTVATPAWAESLGGRHYMVVWGYQAEPNVPENSHTFASFYRGDDLARGTNSPLTISWLPATRVVRPHGQERGRNFSLGETLRIARDRKFTVNAYGPYEIKADLYRRARERLRVLNSGKIQYAMINGSEDAVNCIAAVGEIGGPINTGFDYGFAASLAVVNHLSAWMPNPSRVVQRVANILGIDAIVSRTRRSMQQAYSPIADQFEAEHR